MRNGRSVGMALVVQSSVCFALAATSALLAAGAPRCVTPPGGRWHGININTLSVSNGVKVVTGYKDGDWTRIDDEAQKEVDEGGRCGDPRRGSRPPDAGAAAPVRFAAGVGARSIVRIGKGDLTL